MIIDSKGKVDDRYKGMGTTLVAIAYYDGEFYSLNCGDSRLYRYRNGELKQLSTDHSLSNLRGEKQHSNIITNCIGGGCTSSYVDIVEMTQDILDEDTYLLCSDGKSPLFYAAHRSRAKQGTQHGQRICFLTPAKNKCNRQRPPSARISP